MLASCERPAPPPPRGLTDRCPLRYKARMDLEALSALELPDPEGRRHRLGDLWATRPVALVFLRHFG